MDDTGNNQIQWVFDRNWGSSSEWQNTEDDTHDYFLSFVGVVPTTAAPHALERRKPAPGTAGTVGAGPHSLGEPWLRRL